MNSLPMESFTMMDCGHGDFIATSSAPLLAGRTTNVLQPAFQVPCVAGAESWQAATPMLVGQQNIQQMLLVPVCFVSPSWMNPPVGHDETATMVYPSMGNMQPSQLYQDVGHCMPGSTMQGNYALPQMQNLIATCNPTPCQQAEITPCTQEYVLPEQRIGTPAPSPLCTTLHLEQTETPGGHLTELEDEEYDSVDELSVSAIYDDKYDSRSFASSDASTAVSRSARRRRGRRAAKAKAKQEGLSAFPILEGPPLDQVFVTTDMKRTLAQQLEAGGHEKRMALSKIHGSVLKMAFEPLGCRVVQLAFDVADASERQVMVGELRGHVRDMISSPHANFVIQKVIEVLPVSSANFVAEELLTYAADAARHRFACRILCRLIEHHLCDNMGSTTTTYLIDELLHETEKLIRHNFARHVIELVLEHGSTTQQARIISAIRNDVFRSAKDRYASYVVEQVMYRCSIPERDALAFDLISDIDSFWTLANHECGSHVIKALLKSHGQMCIRANELLNAGASTLCTSKHGHRLLEEIQGSLL